MMMKRFEAPRYLIDMATGKSACHYLCDGAYPKGSPVRFEFQGELEQTRHVLVKLCGIDSKRLTVATEGELCS